MPDLYRMLYCSQSTIEGGDAHVRAEIGRLLTTARRNNLAAGITGALLFTNTHFVQLLEGTPRGLEAAFERICADLRHTNVGVVEYAPVPARTFPRWSMAGLVGSLDMQAVAPEILTGSLAGPGAAEAVIDLMTRLLARQIPLPTIAA